ncbi:xanthine dehydrogenase family protein molybdopterin-binding subunit [Actinomadura rugatobispora]|uniref:Xanthine dehydrogenase family protein molybdopterin-binding subunit n=1 Tax=Actinomadura rugatobispora TaxID=1994 RepID=A0ABW0ZZM0_9ACTN|nr:xanthine dehydrogenase family protein molybdopterin-binding subunit [Actinomadura rugatobispora]
MSTDPLRTAPAGSPATQTAPFGATAARWIGRRMHRREDIRLITGRGRYIDDLNRPGTVHAAFVRSTVARGAITAVDTTAAREAPGVVAVLTAAEVNSPSHQFWQTMTGPESVGTPGRVLADSDVRYVGEPIVLVVAESRYQAEDAAELVEVDIDAEDPVLGFAAALAEDAPRVHPELASNVAEEVPTPEIPGLDERFGSAPHVFTETFDQHRYLCVPMETRGIVSQWDPWTRQLELAISGQGVHEPRLFYSRMLGIPEDAIHVTMGDVGGSFGQKMFPMREEHAVVIASRLIGGRPLKWIEDRAENLIGGGHAREERIELRVATDERGVLLAAEADHLEDVGAYPVPGNGMTAGTGAVMFPGPYRWAGPGSVRYTGRAVYTNTCGHCAYRGPWMMETTGREQMMDVIARDLGIDPLEIRRRNVISRDELPFTTPSTLVYETVSPAETLEQAAELIGYERFRREQEEARGQGRLLGIGLSLYVEPQFGFGHLGTEAATIRIEPSGKVNVYMGTGSHGQSVETTMAQIVADELGVPIDDVRVVQGDSAATPYGPGTGGSRTGAIAGGAAHAAAAAMRERVLGIAAHLLEASPDDVEMVDAVARVRGVPGGPAVTLAEIAAVAYIDSDALPSGGEPGLEVSKRYKSPAFMFSNACHAVTVEIDRETGTVEILRYVVSEDCGNMINPMVVEGQIAGGVVQGIGGVFYEHMIYDAEGNPTTTTFMDYLLPTAAEVPDLEYGHVVTPSGTPGGYKGLGEGGAIASPAALVNAVRDALAPLGVKVNRQALSPDRILDLIDGAGRPAGTA